jgi:coenzyme F420-reducing hydrogenase gamma subunit
VQALDQSTPIAAHVPVDVELPGCPIDRHQLLDTITALLVGRRPAIPTATVCQECKLRGTACLVVTRGTACLGPVTRAGCGALCPAFGRGCFGCFGPTDAPNTAAMVAALRSLGMPAAEAVRVFRTFNAANPRFQQAAEEASA